MVRVMDTYDPWRALASYGNVDVVDAELPPTRRGLIEFATGRITLRPELLDVEKRCTLAHELVHLERGPVLVRQTRREERVVASIAATRLVPLTDLREALRWTTDRHELAEELHVDVRTIDVRLSNLTDAERDALMDP